MTKGKYSVKTETILSWCIHFGEVMILRFVVNFETSSTVSLLCVSVSWNCHYAEHSYHNVVKSLKL